MQVILDRGFQGLDVPPSQELQIHSDALHSASFSCPSFFASALLDSTNLVTDHQEDSKGGEAPRTGGLMHQDPAHTTDLVAVLPGAWFLPGRIPEDVTSTCAGASPSHVHEPLKSLSASPTDLS